MTDRVTIEDVAKLAGVHKGTVSRALNPATEGQVNPATARRVHKAAKQLGYFPNIAARSLRTNRSMAIGVVVPDLTNPIFAAILRGIENHLSPRGYTTLLANTDGREAVERMAVESLRQRNVDGFILATGLDENPILAEIRNRGVKAVLVNRGSGSAPYPLVTGDDAHGIETAVQHLVQLGHRRIAHIAGPSRVSTVRVRKAAFQAAIAGLPGVSGEIIGADALNIASGIAAMDEIMTRRAPRPTAVIAANDLIALGGLRSLRAHGYRCPDDMSIIGYNDIPYAEDFDPPLTTVHVPFIDMGSEAARILLQSLDRDEERQLTVSLPVSLIVRGSTAAPRSTTD